MSVFNLNPTKSYLENTCFFGDPVAVARYDKVRYPQFEKLTRQQIGFFWVPEEIDLMRDYKDFKGLTDHEKHIFTSNLKRQILLDSVQGRAPSLAFLPISSLPEIENWIQTWAFYETIHSRSYTHILRNVYTDPSKIFDELTDLKEIVDCAIDISKYYDDLITYNALLFDKDAYQGNEYDHKKALWLCLNAVNALEGVRFYASFACSWNFAEMKKMEGNAKIIKFICRDENLHLASTQHILKILPKEDQDFVKIAEDCRLEVEQMFDDIVKQEHDWSKYLFKDGSMIGLNERLLCDFVDERADKCLKSIGYAPRYGNKTKVFPWTQKWIAGSEVQVAPQEVELTSYTTGGIKQDISEDTFKDFEL